ncbi:hypothetical protein [Streptomyces sp. NPDC020362]
MLKTLGRFESGTASALCMKCPNCRQRTPNESDNEFLRRRVVKTRGEASAVVRHPLAMLRISAGYSHARYAELVARTHADLGLGRMAARREKISRWESGRVEPELTAQFAIAHIHRVPREAVERLGWPRWLHAAIGEAPPEGRPWTLSVAAATLRDAAQSADVQSRTFLTLTGSAVTALTDAWLTAVNDDAPLLGRTGCRTETSTETIALLEGRVTALEATERQLDAPLLYPAAQAELRLITELLTNTNYDHSTGARLYLLAARVADRCGELATAFGDHASAERYALASLRATVIGPPELASFYLTSLAAHHLEAGDPRDTLHLVHVARSATERPSPSLTALFLAREARAHARLGESVAAADALDRAGAALSQGVDDEATPFFHGARRWLTPRWLDGVAGVAWLHLGKPQRALEYLTPLLDHGPPAGAATTHNAARGLLYMVAAHLANDELEGAIHHARRALNLLRTPPAHYVNQLCSVFAAHELTPAVRELFDEIAERKCSITGGSDDQGDTR